MKKHTEVFYNVQHSPVGAFASFTLGMKGPRGGLGLELSGPACGSVLIGSEGMDGMFDALPYFDDPADERKRYESENPAAAKLPESKVRLISDEKITRTITPATDTLVSGDMTFTVYSPFYKLPDPAKGNDAELKKMLVPSVFATLELDNTKGSIPRKVFFGYQGKDPYSNMRTCNAGPLKGIAQGLCTGIFTTDDMVASQAFNLDIALHNADIPSARDFLLGPGGILAGTVAPGEKKSFRFSICFFKAGPVTSGLDTTYYYTRYFRNLEDAASFGLDNFAWYTGAAKAADALIDTSRLSSDRAFLLSQAVHSYLGSTELLSRDGRPLWVVNEGEYRMMNTFDLTIDQTFFEMLLHPWSVKNILDLFIERYSYRDEIFMQGSDASFKGGISFTHDMGVGNNFTPAGRSCYEMPNLHGCFSQMTMEQLLNFILTYALYEYGADDGEYLKKMTPLLSECLESMLNRDHPDDARRDGLMKFDSRRTIIGSEITTYDSLDASLGQSRNNLYIAMKMWAASLALYSLFIKGGSHDAARRALAQADLISKTVLSRVNADGTIYAVQERGNTSLIIPVIEGLVYPCVTGMCEFAAERYRELFAALGVHIRAVLKKGICLFEDGAFKLSSTSKNSWPSKIFISQFIIENILGIADPALMREADGAHVNWMLDPDNAFFAFSDQFMAGKVCGSRYYPRGVSAVLWLR